MAPRQLASGRRAGAAGRRDRPPRWQDTDLAMPLSSMQPEASGPLVSGICIYYFWTVVHEVTETMKNETTGKVGGGYGPGVKTMFRRERSPTRPVRGQRPANLGSRPVELVSPGEAEIEMAYPYYFIFALIKNRQLSQEATPDGGIRTLRHLCWRKENLSAAGRVGQHEPPVVRLSAAAARGVRVRAGARWPCRGVTCASGPGAGHSDRAAGREEVPGHCSFLLPGRLALSDP